MNKKSAENETVNEISEAEKEFVSVDELECVLCDNSAAHELYLSLNKTRYDGIKKLWQGVITMAAQYAKGEIEIDHDCNGKKEVMDRIRNQSINFLNGNGNFQLACQAAGLDEEDVLAFGRKYKEDLH